MHRRLPTQNRTGWASNQLNEVSERFVAHCRFVTRPVLDIGAAFGLASLAAIEAGATVYANDLDPAHLAQITPAEKLILLPGRFPRDFDLPPASLDAVHASNVLHFLPGDDLTRGLALARRWLAPGGRLFIQVGTPYQQPFQAFLPTFEARLAAGDPWPGWIPDVRAISQHKKLSQIPPSLHLLDQATLGRLVLAHGFAIERCWTYCRRDLPRSMQLDGREGVGLVAISL